MKAYVAALALALMLAGCTPSSDEAAVGPTSSPSRPTASSGPTATAIPTPTPTPTPTVATKPALDEILISHAGLGTVTIGTDLTTLDPAVSIFVATEQDCGDGVIETSWISNYPLPRLSVGNLVPDFDAGLQDVFTGVSIFSPGPRTAVGIQVGSSRAELLAAYPGIAVVSTGSGKDTYAVYGAPANLAFDVLGPDASGFVDVDEINSIRITQRDPAIGTPGFGTPSSCG